MTGENELIARSRAGDADAFAQLVRRHEDRIYRLVRSVCSSMPAEADDVYQETFLTAFRKLKSFREDSELSTWLYRIASNLCFMRHRRRKREPFVALLDRPHGHDHGEGPAHHVADGEPTPEEAAGKKELSAAVAAALSRLPVEYRLVVTLRDVEQLPAAQAAKILKLSVPALKSRLHRGRLFLRAELEKAFASQSS
ncbi:MAG: sigma-70 family RNA polymerase sigma factor [Elusimicrobia bacterium]|nr:sigma-70 family RNA polymerase sigma factor [Elusimicrobiota bacterium]